MPTVKPKKRAYRKLLEISRPKYDHAAIVRRIGESGFNNVNEFAIHAAKKAKIGKRTVYGFLKGEEGYQTARNAETICKALGISAESVTL